MYEIRNKYGEPLMMKDKRTPFRYTTQWTAELAFKFLKKRMPKRERPFHVELIN